MNSKFFPFLKYILLLAAALILLFLAFRGVDVKKIINGMFEANIFWVSLSGVISIVAFISRAYRWKLLIEPMGYSPSLKNSTAALMIGYLANLAFPRLGEVSRCGVLSKTDSVPFNKLLGTVIVERVIDAISLFICLLLAAIVEYKRLGSFLKENMIDPLYGKVDQLWRSPVAITIAAVLILIIVIAVIWTLTRSKKIGKESWFIKLMRGFADGLKSVTRLKRPWLFVFHSFLIWFLYFLGVYVCLFALPSTSGLGVNTALFLLVAGGFGMSAPVQGGIGAYHLLVSQGLMLYGISQQDGLTFATLLHSLQLLLIIAFGVASLILLFGVRKNVGADIKQ